MSTQYENGIYTISEENDSISVRCSKDVIPAVASAIKELHEIPIKEMWASLTDHKAHKYFAQPYTADRLHIGLQGIGYIHVADGVEVESNLPCKIYIGYVRDWNDVQSCYKFAVVTGNSNLAQLKTIEVHVARKFFGIFSYTNGTLSPDYWIERNKQQNEWWQKRLQILEEG